MFRFKTTVFLFSIALLATSCARLSETAHAQMDEDHTHEALDEGMNEHEHGDVELFEEFLYEARACAKANSSQISQINVGNQKKNEFLDYCGSVTNGSSWCQQLIRPNPSSLSTFRCTYGSTQVHQLIHPDTKTWVHAAQAVRLVERLGGMGIKVCQIYNWWRPEPYNKNVGGAAGRHPYGTSVDVRFCSKSDQEKAHKVLCQWRAKGEMRALGYYSSESLHFGIGDATPNTWGKSCP